MLAQIAQDDQNIADRKKRIEELKLELEEAENELQEFHNDNAAKDEELAEMENSIQALLDDRAKQDAEDEERRNKVVVQPRKPTIREKYVPVKGDRVDELMAQYVNNFELDVPVQRLGDGNYMFGSRKIYAKIMNDKLVVRVGGGFMLIDEFLNTYGK